MKTQNRLDLSNTIIVISSLITLMSVSIIFFIPNFTNPASIFGQSAAFIGVFFLFFPFLFSVMKRSGLSKSPPTWFVIHILLAFIGIVFIAIHVSSGDWLTPPGFILFCLFFLLIQGVFLRVVLSKRLSLLFANSAQQNGFRHHINNKEALALIIKKKINLLKLIDSTQDEALFSPAMKHWLQHPFKSTQYQLLADKEARLIGSRKSAGLVMNWSRRIHLLVAFLFFMGLAFHIIIMLFFAGYAANGAEIDWWYITSWGS